MSNPILITGCARSGTSMVAGAIDKCGAFGGDLASATKNNPKGMFENTRIRNTIVKPYLRDLGMDPLGQYPLPDITTLPIPSNLNKLVLQIMKQQGYVKGPWFYKGAKMCLIWPIWKYAFPDAKWIIVRRRDDDIINSCVRTNFMRAFSRETFRNAAGVSDEEAGWRWWIAQHKKRFVEMIDVGLNIKMVWPDRMVNCDYSQIMETIEWLGLKWNSEVLSFIDPKFWHARRKKDG